MQREGRLRKQEKQKRGWFSGWFFGGGEESNAEDKEEGNLGNMSDWNVDGLPEMNHAIDWITGRRKLCKITCVICLNNTLNPLY